MMSEPTTIQSPLADALAHVVRQGESRRLWIETLCLGHQRALNSKERSGKIKFFRTSAQNVTMWIGKDEEPDDILGKYLGPGTVSSTDAPTLFPFEIRFYYNLLIVFGNFPRFFY